MSNDNGRVKTYKNKARTQTPVVQPYVPQYQLHGIEPQQHQGFVGSTIAPVVAGNPQPGTLNNPRVRKPGIRQPYAAVVPSPVGRGRGPVPNVGNNMEHTWSSVDGEIVDDISGVDPEHEMVDNNELVSHEAFGPPPATSVKAAVKVGPPLQFTMAPGEAQEFEQTVSESTDELLPIVHDLEEGAYLLIVDGVPVCSGPMEEIQDQARALVFGEHEMCDGNPVPPDDIIILKRVPVKVGLFLE